MAFYTVTGREGVHLNPLNFLDPPLSALGLYGGLAWRASSLTLLRCCASLALRVTSYCMPLNLVNVRKKATTKRIDRNDNATTTIIP